ncbi:DNA internalization-related competence protein ComEC/Rec2 [Planctobacterium marinum]|uniref:DNA internalization-related competence protein ComEC/Rec2 n=1 Tax=Planctobacterium marinum TaxID=1631968 RepID=UPI001E5EED0A|nr:DNA internalization-related competence protein ComEC/Rec2 [Planctobacterium marinum]MCC2603843.1 DNA internalization-related competence protein ComEC/Rec2 [Planctobacterium marinum]
MDRFLFSFITASATSLVWPGLLPVWTILVLLLLGIALLRKSTSLSGCCFGVLWMLSLGHWVNYTQPKQALFLQPVTLIGEIGTVLVPGNNLKFDLLATHFFSSEGNRKPIATLRPIKIRLSWLQPSLPLKDGQQVQLHVKLKPRWGLSNEAGFNYQTWLFAESIVATGYVKSSELNLIQDSRVTLRQQITDELLQYERPEIRWLLALAIGFRGLLQSEDWTLLQETGTAHLVAISGMHLGMVALWSYLLCCALCTLWNALLARHVISNIRVFGLTVSLIVSFAYLYLADFAVPTLRAWLMLLLAWYLVVTGIHWPARRFILTSLALFIVLFPLSLFSFSFWLSFSAIVILWFLFWRFPLRGKGVITKAGYFVKLQLGISVLMLPGLIWMFQGVSVIAPVINLLAIPFVTLVLLPVSLMATLAIILVPELAPWLMALSLELFSGCEQLLTQLIALPVHWFNVSLSQPASVLFLLLFVVALLMPRVVIPKPLFLLFLLPSLSEFKIANHPYWQADILDVGNGLAVLLRRNGRAVLYDTGASFPDGFSMAQAVINPVLDKAKIRQLDKLIISHSDNDHIGGLPAILRDYSVSELIVKKGDCRRGMNWHWQGIHFEVLWPDFNFPELLKADNNQSCVVMLDDGKHRLLLPGDIEAKVEALLADWHRQGKIDLRADVVLAPHHGSKSSSSGAFVLAVSPQYVLVSSGFMNRWRMPADIVKKRYHKIGASVYNTAQLGQLSVRFYTSQGPQVLSWRNDEHPRWYLRD